MSQTNREEASGKFGGGLMSSGENKPGRRRIVWFSCGAPSAVAAKLTVNSDPACVVASIEIKEEHPDNARFLADVQAWIDHPITPLGNDSYARSIYEVFRRERYLVGISGAPCTRLLKRGVREVFQECDDIHVMGFTFEEKNRVEDFHEHFPTLELECPLIDRGISKADCLGMIESAGIELPMMYRLGFKNNNCIGCVKGGMGYWNKIRIHFPERFAQMAATEREIGHSINRRNGKPVYLDELPVDAGRDVPEPKIECSIMCMTAMQEYGA